MIRRMLHSMKPDDVRAREERAFELQRQGLDYHTIAERLQISLSSVSTMLRRARERREAANG